MTALPHSYATAEHGTRTNMSMSADGAIMIYRRPGINNRIGTDLASGLNNDASHYLRTIKNCYLPSYCSTWMNDGSKEIPGV